MNKLLVLEKIYLYKRKSLWISI